MKHFDFPTLRDAENFKEKTERLGWETSTITYHPQYGWFVISNWPY